MELILDNKNELLDRREIKMIVENSGNPGFENAMKIVAEHFKTDSENIAVHNVKGKFGRDTFLIDAFIYGSKESREKMEPKPKVKKSALGAAAPASAVPAVAAVEAKK